jgi:hypothetical protein
MAAKRPKNPRTRGSAAAYATPKTERDKLFCKKWLEHFDKERAYAEAGFKATPRGLRIQATRKLNRFAEYLRPFQEAKAAEVAKTILMDDEAILKAMARKAVFDPGDYVEKATEPALEVVSEGKRKVTRVRTWEGKVIYAERMKPFHELTPEQRMTVEILGIVDDQVEYRLPTTREQLTAQVNIGRQFGMFLDKLIIERSQSRGAHQNLSLANVPTPELQDITLKLLPYVGQEFASRLGFTLEDIERAKRRVVATQPKTD